MAAKRITTVKQVQYAGPGKHSVGGGLTLAVKASGARSWIVRVTVPDGTRKDRGIGGYPKVSLREARQLAADVRIAAAAGVMPAAIEAAPPPPLPTFGEAAAVVHADNCKAGHYRSDQYAATWLRSLEIHAAPLMRMRVDTIRTADVLDVLRPIWIDINPTARKVHWRISEVMEWAMTRYEDDVTRNPAHRGIVKGLPKVRAATSHHQAMGYSDVAAALAALDGSTSGDAAKLCLRFTVLTAARSGEARGALWSEMDTDAAAWSLPGDRMKSGREHRVPLSKQALEVLAAARDLDDGSGYVFPSPQLPGNALTWQCVSALIRSLKLPTTAHGFRSSFRTWTLECTMTPWAVSEAALAHAVGNQTQAAYIRSDVFEARRELMQAWADYIA